jgi:uncharacterized membrane protein
MDSGVKYCRFFRWLFCCFSIVAFVLSFINVYGLFFGFVSFFGSNYMISSGDTFGMNKFSRIVSIIAIIISLLVLIIRISSFVSFTHSTDSFLTLL